MAVNRILVSCLLAIFLLAGCKSKKKPSLSGEEKVDADDFVEFFQPLAPPCQFGDTLLAKKAKDSMLISYKVFTQFIPDSILTKVYGKGVKPKIHALGRADVAGNESYLFVRTLAADKKAIFLICFDKKNKFIAAMPVLRPDQNAATTQTVSFDKRLSLTKTVQRKNSDGSISEGKDVYVLNADAGEFTLIMTEALEDKVTELINPIDTLPRQHKFSADYGPGKMNLVSVRDGRKADRLSFFIHVEKNNGACIGELKGEAMIKSSSTAEYRESGDPCVLTFRFTSSSVTLEEQNCGSRHSLNCSFDGSYGRRKWVKPTPPKPAKTPSGRKTGKK